MSHNTTSPQSEEEGPTAVVVDFSEREWPVILDADPPPDARSPTGVIGRPS